ncbi:40S ribosomal protein S27 [Triticum aestivum]|uniref:Uncharacterized protein n=1 Tax=Aegilops tauschii subsp. strangulata TaxID=200361 RepID=A0A453SYT6_AEGTS|nr:40S ribosomal protein S27 [Aegilops tauschii subsp. strangulata]XP_044439469.1 40S ribosomal protein S27-like [Triticum aestivum]
MDVKSQGCFNITTVFSHSQTMVVCPGWETVLCRPTGGKARLTEGCSFCRKGNKGISRSSYGDLIYHCNGYCHTIDVFTGVEVSTPRLPSSAKCGKNSIRMAF